MKEDFDNLTIGVIGLALFLIIAFTVKWVQVKMFYGGDMRCVFAECRIQK